MPSKPVLLRRQSGHPKADGPIPRMSDTSLERSGTSMVSIGLSPPRTRHHQECPPSPKTRALRRVTISHNTTTRDRLTTTVTDLAYQATWELQTAFHNPTYAARRLSNTVIASTGSAPSHITDMCANIVQEGEKISAKLIRGCGGVIKTAGSAARRASVSLTRQQPRYSEGSGSDSDSDSDDSFEVVSRDGDIPEGLIEILLEQR
ncbi:hypothetical protein H072_8283 [Dactylellina haptotyla CBS 200.50]|uniref:Uncharacterized protein n=1 Tax=Dactylellina haptotyla (strain CBS 200.50) TaxID=1284197 RepID=S8BFF4_DACHA|nr:hypothetical protein H072_8283 [Dactylellina haptotyla CBS 200.50]